MRRDGEPATSNVFVRFKQHVDATVAAGLHSLLGFPPPPLRPCSDVSPPSSHGVSPSRSGVSPSRSDVSPPSRSDVSPPSRSDVSPTSRSTAMDVQEPRRPASCDVLSLLSSGSYSPATLRHLPQPVPNDLPPALDPSIFTFEDAFEDLLAVSQDRPLPDIGTRHDQRKLLRSMFPAGEPAWFWVRRLQSQGLIQNPELVPFTQTLRPDWDSFHRELDRRAAEVWRAATGDADHLFHGLGQAFKQLERGFSHGPSRHDESDPHEWQRPGPREPDTFDELFSALSSAFADGQRSWDTFVKTITDRAEPPEKRQTPGAANDTKQVETRDEYVDRFGYLHSTITRKTLDKDGNEIGRETYVTMRPADRPLDNQNNDELDHVDSAGDESASKKSGWFWK